MAENKREESKKTTVEKELASAIALAGTRAAMYRFLGGLYIMEVDKEQLSLLKAMTFPEVQGNTDADQDLRDGYALMSSYLAEFPEEEKTGENDEKLVGKADAAENSGTAIAENDAEIMGKAGAVAENPELEAKLDDLAADYAKVFLAAGDATGRAAFPYESVYVDRRHRVGGSTEMQMRSLFLERGLKADPDTYRTMDDNIGLMLEYQANVCEELAAALEAGETEKANAILAEQKAFVKKHLTNWIYTFTSDVIRYSERDFYKGVAKVTSGFIKKEAEYLKKQ